MTPDLSSLGWFLVGVISLAILQRWLHIEIQSVFFLITRRLELALAIFSILFLPGVLLHELSHYLIARLLGVPVGNISIIPQALPDGRLRMGYVETASTDIFRDALIGTAPLIAGSIFIAYAGLVRLEFAPVWEQISNGDLPEYIQVMNQPDFWIWFYFIFVVSSTMFPSASDRRAWMPILILVALIVALLLISGAGPWLWENLGTSLLSFVHILSLIFVLSALVHLILLPPLWLLRQLLQKMTGLKVV
ncbi:MAG: hypothetical protein JSW42_10145 [Chloroflexota bacterium]|nr:MAG: hypothetical protein JSW42_10145 [Chloroflexota bacterium]